ncbi:MAG: heme ABC transporter ATP-binding protein [Pyrinomonadaceae bacterium]
MFRAENISYSAGGKTILKDISLDVVPGEITAIVGANGAGKSSLLRILSGERAPTYGRVTLDGNDIAELSHKKLARRRAVLSQFTDLRFPFTGVEVVLLGRNPHIQGGESKLDRRIAIEALEVVEALHLMDRRIDVMSGGERQRIHLARVLAQIWTEREEESRYLFLDEPTSSLDIAHQHLTLEIAERFAANGLGVVVILHDLNLVSRYADRVLVLKNGQVRAMGAPAENLTSAVIEEVFEVSSVVVDIPGGSGAPLIVPFSRIK